MSDVSRLNLRDALRNIVPNWLSNRRGLNVAFSVLYVIAMMCDFLIEAMIQGVWAAWPGKGDPSALPYIGQSRGIPRGLSESDASYAARLIGWLTTWVESGSDALLIQLLQIYLGGNLPVRIVDRAGQFTSIDAAGNVTFTTDATWNFDSVEFPVRAGWWSDLWVIVYITDGRWPPYTATLSDSAWLAAWGTYNGFAVGMQVPVAVAQGIVSITHTFKGAHAWLEAIVFTTDTALFIPGALTSGFPDGKWGNWSRQIAGVQTPARATVSSGGVLRYMVPNNGG